MGCLGGAKPSAWGSGKPQRVWGQVWEQYGVLCLGEGTQASVQGYADVYSHVCASVWVAARGVFWVCLRLCVCACACVWAGSCQDRAATVPRPALPLVPTRHDSALPGSMKGPCVPGGFLHLLPSAHPPKRFAEGGEGPQNPTLPAHKQGTAVWAQGWVALTLSLRRGLKHRKSLCPSPPVPCHTDRCTGR